MDSNQPDMKYDASKKIPYYDNRGLLIKDSKKCTLHYLSGTFVADLLGIFPINVLLHILMRDRNFGNMEYLLDNIPQFAHVYLIAGYFNYHANAPSMKSIYILIFKWQLLLTIMFLAGSAFFVERCVNFEWNEYDRLTSMAISDLCWLPSTPHISKHLSMAELQYVFAQALSMGQNALHTVHRGLLSMKHNDYSTICIFSLLGVFYWYVIIYNETLLMLQSRSHNIFHHSVNQLTDFLKNERVEKEVVDKVIEHYNYIWLRTKGLNIQNLMTERIGMIFREDLNYYFYKKTFAALDTMIKGGEAMQRRLANIMIQSHFLPGEDIMREMDLISKIFVVHRGCVLVTQNNKKLAILYKGGVFGQFEAGKLRPVKVTVQALEHTDILTMTVKEYQDVLTDSEKRAVLSYPETSNDYLALKKVLIENPYNTIRYLLRGTKAIKLPRMSEPIEADKNKWYSYYLIFIWLGVTSTTVTITLIMQVVPSESQRQFRVALFVLDFIHFLNMIVEFHAMELVVEGNKCVYKYYGLSILRDVEFYLDVASLVVPFTADFTGNVGYGMFRVIRLQHYSSFYQHFCTNVKHRSSGIILKCFIGLLVLHTVACGWMYISCRDIADNSYGQSFKITDKAVNASINYNEWSSPLERGRGCLRVTRFTRKAHNKIVWFVVGKTWHVDYLMALTNFVIFYMRLNLDVMLGLSLGQLYYKVFVVIILYMGEMWISSIAISTIYTKYREMYLYAYDVSNLIQYLKQNHLSKKMLGAVKWYTKMLWSRQKGTWIPDMALTAPICLREDIFSALYIHHLMTPTLFQNHLPAYFMRQLVVRFKRMVIFPGKYIVKEGDIYPSIYFIHEGEVERWYTDVNGNHKLSSVLTMNGYFGLIPGLFPNTPFLFTYCSRTVCDLLLLKHEDWQDLLNGYPEIKINLYKAAKDMQSKIYKEQKKHE